MDALYTFGVSVKDAVLWISGLLTADASPGIVVIGLVLGRVSKLVEIAQRRSPDIGICA